MRTLGIDVSTYQDDPNTAQVIDWSKPKTRGVRFVINRLANADKIDTDLAINYAAQGQYGYIRGGYGWWDYRVGAPTDAVQGRAAGLIAKAYPGEMPVVWCDWERPGANWPALPPRKECLAKMKAYKDAAELASGKKTGAYMNGAMIQYLTSENGITVPLPDWLRAMPLWIAAWPAPPAGETLEAYIQRTNWTPNLRGQWGKYTIWQFGTPAYGRAMGMESGDIDVDYFNGSEAELLAWCGTPAEEPKPMANHYKDNSMGYYAQTLTDAGWENTGFDFFVVPGCAGYEQPNPQLKPMETKAREKGKYLFIEYKFSMGYYTGQQYPMDDKKWPALHMDAPLLAFIDTLKNRNPDAVIITYLDPNDHTGKPGNKAWVSFAGRNFINKAKDWLAKNKPGVEVYIRTSHPFLTQYAPDAINWIHQHETIVEQPAISPLDASYPQETDKPAYVGASDGWEFWSYRPTIYLYKGTRAQLAAELGKVITPPPDTKPEDPPPAGEVTAEQFAALTARVAALEAFRDKVKAA